MGQIRWQGLLQGYWKGVGRRGAGRRRIVVEGGRGREERRGEVDGDGDGDGDGELPVRYLLVLCCTVPVLCIPARPESSGGTKAERSSGPGGVGRKKSSRAIANNKQNNK